MKKRIISIFLAFILMIGCMSTTAFAADSTGLSGIDALIEKIEGFRIGNAARDIASATGFTDAYHVVSANGEPVNISTSDLVCTIMNTLSSLGKYRVSYQWYSCTDKLTNLHKLDGETGTELKTSAFSDTGFQFYVCKIAIYQKIGLSYVKVRTVCTPVYAVGYTGQPVIYINTADGEYITSKEVWLEGASIRIDGGKQSDYSLSEQTIRVKGRGNSTWENSSKAGYTVKFEKKQDLFGIGADKTWALVGNFSDKSLLRNWLASVLDKNAFDDGSEWNVTHMPVELVINGEYRGQFTLATTVRLGDNRIDVADISKEIKKDRNNDGVKDYFDAGFVVEIDNREDSSHHFITEIAGMKVSLSDPDLDDPADTNDSIFNHIFGVVQNAENVIYSESFSDPETGYASVIDVDSFIDYYLLEELAKDRDGMQMSTFMYYEPTDGKLHMTSAWDFDTAFGNYMWEESVDTEGFEINDRWYARLLEDPAFASAVANRWFEVRSQVLDILNNELPAQVDAIRTSAQMNFMKWPELGTLVWPFTKGWSARWTYQSEVDYLYDWTIERIAWLDEAYALMR